MRSKSISKSRIVFICCWCAYALAYTLRVNITAAIPAMKESMGYTNTQSGLVISLFFITYTIGQLINGYLGDRLNNKRHIIIGLILSAILNICVSFSNSIVLTAILWSINGFAQSMLWGPIVKTLSAWFKNHQFEKVTFYMALSMIIGSALSWGSSSLLAYFLDWRYIFVLPAILVLIFVIIFAFLFKNSPDEKQEESVIQCTDNKVSFWKYSRIINLPYLLLIALMLGIIKEGINVWFPTILQESQVFAASSTWKVLAIVPLLNMLGVLAIRFKNKKFRGNSSPTILSAYTILASISAIMVIIPSYNFIFILVAMTGLLSYSYGLTAIITSSIPLQHSRYNRVSLTAGLLDFFVYLGASLSCLLSGIIADNTQWSNVRYIWVVAAFIGLIISIILNLKKQEVKQ